MSAVLTNSLDRQSALHWAAANGDVKCMRWLLHKGTNPNSRNSAGGTALHSAATRGQNESIKVRDVFAAVPIVSASVAENLNRKAIENNICGRQESSRGTSEHHFICRTIAYAFYARVVAQLLC